MKLVEIIVVFSVCTGTVFSAATNRRTSRVRVEKKVASDPLQTLSLPSNATAIRSDITDHFSCAHKTYGYYADVDNDCQIFHVCLPVTFADGNEKMYRWSFICPEETAFNQEAFTCVRSDEMPFDCADSERFYDLNRNLGAKDEVKEIDSNELLAVGPSSNREKIADDRKSAMAISTFGSVASTPSVTTIAATTPAAEVVQVSNSINVNPANPPRPQRPVVANVSDASIYRPSETNTLLESALKQENFVKILKSPEIAEVVIAQNPTTLFDDGNVTEVTTLFEPQTTIQDTTEQFLYTRIVPELIENNEKIVTSHIEPNLSGLVDAQQNSEADQLIRNIKQLQNSLLGNVPTTTAMNTAIPSTEKPSPAATSRVPLPRRFLFKADNLKYRLRQY